MPPPHTKLSVMTSESMVQTVVLQSPATVNLIYSVQVYSSKNIFNMRGSLFYIVTSIVLQIKIIRYVKVGEDCTLNPHRTFFKTW